MPFPRHSRQPIDVIAVQSEVVVTSLPMLKTAISPVGPGDPLDPNTIETSPAAVHRHSWLNDLAILESHPSRIGPPRGSSRPHELILDTPVFEESDIDHLIHRLDHIKARTPAAQTRPNDRTRGIDLGGR